MLRKLRKIAFSRLFVVGMAIVMQLALFFVMLLWLDEYSHIFNTVMSIVSFAVIVSVINRNMIVEAKIPWIILILLMPLFGTALYLSFSGSKMPKKHRKLFVSISEGIGSCFDEEIKSVESVFKEVGTNADMCRYIYNTTLQLPYKNTKTNFYSSGESFFDALLAELKKAEKFIFMEYFIIAEGYMWNSIFDILQKKASEGVQVRIMYDDLGSVGTLKSNFYKQLCKCGIKCIKFHPFIPVVSEVHNNRDHRKITVIDGKCAFIGGANIADEYINKINRINGHWKDSVIKLTGDAVKSVTAMFLHLYGIQSGVVENYKDYMIAHPSTGEKGFVIPFSDGPKPAYAQHVGENVILNMIYSAKEYIWITTPYLIIDDKLRNALCSAAFRGVDVRIVTPHIPDKKLIFAITHSFYPYLQKRGVKIYEYTPGFIHSKQIVCDGKTAVVGTINLDYRSLVHHYECGVLLINTDSVSDIKKDFENIFECSQNMINFRQNPFVSVLCRICSAFTPML